MIRRKHMEITVTEKAQKWFEEEMAITNNNGVRFLAKIYGDSPIHDGFSVGIQVAEPENVVALKRVNDISYFIEENDEWFFAGYDLEVAFDEKLNEPAYLFHKITE